MLTVDCNLLGIKDGEQVLDVGCGEGRHSWEVLRRNGCLICALDIGEESMVKAGYVFRLMDEQGESKGRWALLRGDAMSLPFRDGCFDRVICSEVLEHLPDDERGIRELVRVLKGDGVLAISVPTYLTESIYWKLSKDYHSNPGGHVRKYKAGELIASLRRHNLCIHAVRHKHALHSIYWLLRCLFGVGNERAPVPSLYHRFLVWDLETRSRPVRLLDDLLNHLFPKSLVLYAHKNRQGDEP